MAYVVNYTWQEVESGDYSAFSEPSFYAWPGSGGLRHTYAYITGWIGIVLGDDNNYYVCFGSSFELSKSSLIGSGTMESFFNFYDHYEEWNAWDGKPSHTDIDFAPYRSAGSGSFSWHWGDEYTTISEISVGDYIGDGYHYIGPASGSGSPIAFPEDDDPYTYILGGCWDWAAQDSNDVPAYKLYVPGAIVFKDYFPFAIKHSSGWESCNREGGSVQMRESGSWTDKKNTAGDETGTVYYRNGSSWSVCPKIEE